MSTRQYNPVKIFTLEEANARLPLVRMIVGDLVELARNLVERRDRLNQLKRGRTTDASDVYQAEVGQAELELEKEGERLNGFLHELLELGVEPKSATAGLVDFPAMLDGKLVYLCWKYDEPEVLFWHDLDSGFAGRQSLTAGSVADSNPSDGLLDV